MGRTNLHCPKEGQKGSLGLWFQGTQQTYQARDLSTTKDHGHTSWMPWLQVLHKEDGHFHAVLHFWILGQSIQGSLRCCHSIRQIQVQLPPDGHQARCSRRYRRMWQLHLRYFAGCLQQFLGESFEDTWTHIDLSVQANNFTFDPLKCEWAVQETDWLSYWLTPNGFKPWKKKIEVILNILEAPWNIKEVCSFVRTVTYYHAVFPRRSYILWPLTELTKRHKATFIWTIEVQKAFDQMKALIIAQDTLVPYPDHNNEEFHVITDTSDYQLGALIMQKGAPVAFYSRKLNPS